jgi:hypothetical protein
MSFDILMDSERFRALVTAPGPFVSVYLDDSRNTSDAEAHLVAIWRGLRTQLEEAGADDDMIATVLQAVMEGKPAVGRQGRAIIGTRHEVLINEHLSSPPLKTIARLSEYPYLIPLVELERRCPTYIFAAVDHLGADITVHRGDAVSAESIDGGGYPVHKPVTAGWNGYGDVQHSAEEAVRMNVRAVADRLTELVDQTGAQVVFVCGEVRSRTDVVSALPVRVSGRVTQLHAGARGHRVREDEIHTMIEEAFEQRRQAATSEIIARFESEIGRHSGLAAEGLEAVCAELREGAVKTLIVANLADAMVVSGENRTTIAPDADVLSELGEAPRRVARADEALPFAAVCIGAALVQVDGINPADGVAALLRYAPSGVAQSSSRESALP